MWRCCRCNTLSIIKDAHAPINSVFVLEPSPQLKRHLTSEELRVFRIPPAPQVVPPLIDAPSKKINECP
jgi:hypothetical protein